MRKDLEKELQADEKRLRLFAEKRKQQEVRASAPQKFHDSERGNDIARPSFEILHLYLCFVLRRCVCFGEFPCRLLSVNHVTTLLGMPYSARSM